MVLYVSLLESSNLARYPGDSLGHSQIPCSVAQRMVREGRLSFSGKAVRDNPRIATNWVAGLLSSKSATIVLLHRS